jgi:hypothetical protein
MSWVTSGPANSKHWVFNATHSGITRTSIAATLSTTFLRYSNSSNYTFSPEKTYLFKTKVNNFTNQFIYKFLEIRSFGKSFTYNYDAITFQSKLPFDNSTNVYLNWYASPNSLTTTNDLVEYFATYNGFGTHSGSTTASVIQEFSLTEINWKLQGWSWATASGDNNYEGWRFNENDESFTFRQFGGSNYRLPGDGRTGSNYVSQFISYDQFNLEFYYTKPLSVPAATLDIWMSDILLPDTTDINTFTASLNNGQKLATLTQSGTYSFYGVSGNRWLNFVANYSNTTNYQIDIENINIQGGYSPTDNNVQFVFDPLVNNITGTSPYSGYTTITTTNLTRHNPTGSVFFGATGNPGFFSNIYGTVVNLSQQVSKLGNGTFKAGIWENGVWNSGWRVDNQIYELSDIIASFNLNTKNSKWRIQISGPIQSISNFELGDKVAISNIVAIDINEKRKLMKNFFTIINKNDDNIVVEIENNFPIRRIEKDSEFHKIRITKNVWLNGGFLNGYFEGIWNDGLYKGYPFITQMKNTHWIDGAFDGGYFNSFYPEYIFRDTLWTNGNVGLSFSTPHGFLLGDLIVIDKDNKTINLDYDGTASIIEIISDKYIVTDIPWGTDTTLETGLVRRYTATGLVQNFEFYDNNVAAKNSKQSQVLKDIWKFNSWMDINFSEESSTNINGQKLYWDDVFGIGDFASLNLYGYITKDVLSSDSSFRDIDSFIKRKYSLGTKYDIYQDFLGEVSEFNEPFGNRGLYGGENRFFENGWSLSRKMELTFFFSDNVFVTGSFVGFIGSSQPSLNVGNIIEVRQTPPFTNESYEGYAQVTGIQFLTASNVWLVSTNKPFASSTPQEGGIIRRASLSSSSLNLSIGSWEDNNFTSFTYSKTVDGTLLFNFDFGIQQYLNLENLNINIERNRYSIIEFDVLQQESELFNSSSLSPIDLFNNTTFINSDGTFTLTAAFPNSNKVNYLQTPNIRKVEYFYNRPGLDIRLISPGYVLGKEYNGSIIELDDIKFYEVDAVPFFQYTTGDYVNKGVQVPYQGIAPFIDYENSEFSFVDNIVISLDSIDIQSTGVPIVSSSTGNPLIYSEVDNNNIAPPIFP